MIKIAPSILSANFAKLGQEIESITQAGADMIHIDIMDGHFVPNITIGPPVIKSIRKHTSIPFDVHLMVTSPEHLFEDLVQAGSDIITIHLEATSDPSKALAQIKTLGVKAGISILPSTPANVLKSLIDQLDLILVMTVQPGYGGQSFMDNQLHKIQEISEMTNNTDIILSVDGGINPISAKQSIAAGATMLVSGSYIFSNPNYENAIGHLKSIHYTNYRL
jgi:ribulose-phosphate 3-epimerase